MTRSLNHVVVTPMAHVTLVNLDYQIYLNQILHTSAGAWLGHVVCIPINVALLFYALAYHDHGSAGLVLLGLLGAWYLAMAVKLRDRLWAVVALGLLALTWAAGSSCASLVVEHYGLAPWYLRPLPLIAMVSTAQAYTHLFEEQVPPRANFEQRWLPVREFLWGTGSELSLGRKLLRLAWTPLGGLWGAFDEWWASAKLMPIYALELLWALGYRRDQREMFRRAALEALASGDPALDWVGVGGGQSVAALGEPNADELELGEAAVAPAS